MVLRLIAERIRGDLGRVIRVDLKAIARKLEKKYSI